MDAISELKQLDLIDRKNKKPHLPSSEFIEKNFNDGTIEGLHCCITRWLELNNHIFEVESNNSDFSIKFYLDGRQVYIDQVPKHNKEVQPLESNDRIFLEVMDFEDFVKKYKLLIK